MGEDVAEKHQESGKSQLTVINGHQRNQCNQRNQFPERTAVRVRDTYTEEAGTATLKEQKETAFDRNLCPHHPQAQLVRFDPSGQAWCDKMDCWDCYRLMKIGEALEYRCLMNEAGKMVIDQGVVAWSVFVRTQRAFLIVVATEQAIAFCKAMEIEVPDISDEVKQLVEVHPAPP
jgi:hypothetical protein